MKPAKSGNKSSSPNSSRGEWLYDLGGGHEARPLIGQYLSRGAARGGLNKPAKLMARFKVRKTAGEGLQQEELGLVSTAGNEWNTMTREYGKKFQRWRGGGGGNSMCDSRGIRLIFL